MGRIESAWVEPAATALRAVMLAGAVYGTAAVNDSERRERGKY